MSLTISLTPEDVQQRLARMHISAKFTAEEHAIFATIPAVDAPGRTIAFPIPSDNSNLTLERLKSSVGADSRSLPCFFEHPWYENEEFMRIPCEPGWHFLLMDVLQDSIERPANYLNSLKQDALKLPRAIEVVLMLFFHYVGTGEQLLQKKHTWCSDHASLNRQVTVGAFGRNGVFLSGHPSNFASRGLGICPKITG